MFEKRDVCNDKIEELAVELERICYRNGIPAHISIAVTDDGKKTEYINYMVSAYAVKEQLSQDKIAKHAKVDAGFDDYVEELRSVDADELQDLLKHES